MAMARSASVMAGLGAPFPSTSALGAPCCYITFSPLSSSFSGSRLRQSLPFGGGGACSSSVPTAMMPRGENPQAGSVYWNPRHIQNCTDSTTRSTGFIQHTSLLGADFAAVVVNSGGGLRYQVAENEEAGTESYLQVRRSLDNSNVSGGLFDLYKPSFGIRSTTSSIRDLSKFRVVRLRANVEDGVKTSETVSSEETLASTPNIDPPTLESPPLSPSNPFATGKISKIASKHAGDTKNYVSASVAQKAAIPLKKPAAAKPPAVGQLSANAAAQLKVSRSPSVFTVPTKPTEEKASSPFAKPSDGKPTSPFTQAGLSKPTAPTNPFRKAPLVPVDWEKAGARPAGSGKRVLDAFKEGEKEGNTTKFGQPLVPTNIFDEVRRTPEEIAADAFKFEISPGQFLLAASFLVVIGVMFGTVFLVWKVGAIHYNEY